MKKEMKKHLTDVADESEIIIDMESFSPDYEREISPKEYNSENKCVFYAIVVINKDKSYSSDSGEIYSALTQMIESVGECNGGIGVYLTDAKTLGEIREHASKHPEMGSEILDMCPEGFTSAVTGGKIEKTMQELEMELY